MPRKKATANALNSPADAPPRAAAPSAGRATRAAPAAAPAVHGNTSAARTVVVGCKLGFARVELQLQKKFEVTEQTQAGPRQIPQWRRVGGTWVIRGMAYPAGTPPKGFMKRAEESSHGDYVLTRGVPKDFWDQWLEQNKDAEMVKNHLIMAFPDVADLEAFAADFEAEKCQLSPLDMPDREGEPTDSRVPKSSHSALGEIEHASRG